MRVFVDLSGCGVGAKKQCALLMAYDPVVSEYRAFFELLDWSQVPERDESQPWPGSPPHPQRAYVKALLVKICEEFEYISDLRKFLVKHPLLILELGFRPGDGVVGVFLDPDLAVCPGRGCRTGPGCPRESVGGAPGSAHPLFAGFPGQRPRPAVPGLLGPHRAADLGVEADMWFWHRAA